MRCNEAYRVEFEKVEKGYLFWPGTLCWNMHPTFGHRPEQIGHGTLFWVSVISVTYLVLMFFLIPNRATWGQCGLNRSLQLLAFPNTWKYDLEVASDWWQANLFIARPKRNDTGLTESSSYLFYIFHKRLTDVCRTYSVSNWNFFTSQPNSWFKAWVTRDHGNYMIYIAIMFIIRWRSILYIHYNHVLARKDTAH